MCTIAIQLKLMILSFALTSSWLDPAAVSLLPQMPIARKAMLSTYLLIISTDGFLEVRRR